MLGPKIVKSISVLLYLDTYCATFSYCALELKGSNFASSRAVFCNVFQVSWDKTITFQLCTACCSNDCCSSCCLALFLQVQLLNCTWTTTLSTCLWPLNPYAYRNQFSQLHSSLTALLLKISHVTEKKRKLSISSREHGNLGFFLKIMLMEVSYSENFAYFSLLHMDLENN